MHHFIPDKLRPWIVILFVIVFQLSGGIYLASVSEMIGSLALMQEDILMAGYSSLVGMSLTFAIMFRLKFAFKPKTSLLICCAAIIICNVICMHTANLPILIFTCFISGVFRMWGTFECNSTIQLWLTPKRDLSVFFCYIYLLVQGTMLLSGITTNYISIISKWEYMHYFVIILLFIVMLLVMLIYNNKRFIKRLPLYGIDWTGAILWGVTVLSMIFVGLYGEYYDWWSSEWIVLGTIIAILSLSVNIIRASFIRHPFISNSLWNYKIIWIVILLYFIYDLLLSPSHLLEHIYLSDILGYDEYHINTLNWIRSEERRVGKEC